MTRTLYAGVLLAVTLALLSGPATAAPLITIDDINVVDGRVWMTFTNHTDTPILGTLAVRVQLVGGTTARFLETIYLDRDITEACEIGNGPPPTGDPDPETEDPEPSLVDLVSSAEFVYVVQVGSK